MVVDNSKVLNTNAEWFIEAPPQSVEGCFGGCELSVQESVILNEGQVSRTMYQESNGVRICVQASADGSVDYRSYWSLHMSVPDTTIYQAIYQLRWIPKLSQDVTVTFLNTTAVDTYDPSHLSQLRFSFGVSNITNLQVIGYPLSDTVNVTSGSSITFPTDFRITTQTRHSLSLGIWPTDKSLSYLVRVDPFDDDYRSVGPLRLDGHYFFDFMENLGEGIHSIKGVAYPVDYPGAFGGIITDQQGHRTYVDFRGSQHRLLF